ncbi:uncharacterized protein LOC114663347 isoform X1 [Erpetoichthys calabaricus]|uniref:uncharacterized protein LOC114663347 isoform X1 n=1 Tax=Erpetoichthys calabaricus TaxID=27687 RepID=UPI00109FEFCD|nr:uncharacterized protein LOC114663347 isoform X1 [Erpetoichthys calabaricus]
MPRQAPRSDGIRERQPLHAGSQPGRAELVLCFAGRGCPGPHVWQKHAEPQRWADVAAAERAAGKETLHLEEPACRCTRRSGAKMAADRKSLLETSTGLDGVSCVPANEYIEAGPRNVRLVPGRDLIGLEEPHRKQPAKMTDNPVSQSSADFLCLSLMQVLSVLRAELQELKGEAVASETSEWRDAGVFGRRGTAETL